MRLHVCDCPTQHLAKLCSTAAKVEPCSAVSLDNPVLSPTLAPVDPKEAHRKAAAEKWPVLKQTALHQLFALYTTSPAVTFAPIILTMNSRDCLHFLDKHTLNKMHLLTTGRCSLQLLMQCDYSVLKLLKRLYSIQMSYSLSQVLLFNVLLVFSNTLVIFLVIGAFCKETEWECLG